MKEIQTEQTEGKTLYVNRRIYRSPVRSIFEKFGRQKEVSLVYGEPLEYENTCVLPVAKVHYFVGGGGSGAQIRKTVSRQQDKVTGRRRPYLSKTSRYI